MATYVVRHVLGPVVQNELIKDANTSENIYTLLLDEITTKQVVKQMDFLMHHWSNSKNQVVTRYLDSKFLVMSNQTFVIK